MKNNNKDIINFNEYYVISSNLSINKNKIIKKKIKNIKNALKIPVIILSKTDNKNEVLVEIKKETGDFIKGMSYLISVELL